MRCSFSSFDFEVTPKWSLKFAQKSKNPLRLWRYLTQDLSTFARFCHSSKWTWLNQWNHDPMKGKENMEMLGNQDLCLSEERKPLNMSKAFLPKQFQNSFPNSHSNRRYLNPPTVFDSSDLFCPFWSVLRASYLWVM